MQPKSSAAVLESDDEQATRRRFRAVFPGLLLILAIAALDQNIVSTALPRIVGSLGGLSRIAWVVTAFLLCSTVTTPLYGKLSDMYGRRPLFFAAVLIFLLGSVLCGMARSMNELIVFRGLQGLGAGGLITLTQTTIGDFVAPRQRAKYQGYFSAVITLCSIAGPLLGGFITEALSWRWVFYVNVPVGAVALTIIGVGLPPGRRVRKHQVDYLGIILLTISTSSLLALLGLVGEPEPASPANIAGFALLAVLGLVAMVFRARVAPEPVIPPILFRSRVFVVATLTVALNFLALQAVGLFLPLFFQLVMGMSPSRAGLMTVPLMGGLIVSSIVGGKIVSAIGRYKMLPVVGLALVAFADFSLSAVVSGGAVRLSVMLSLIMLIGLGAGLILPILTMAIQNAVDPANLGAATATSIFFRSLGATFGVTLAGAIVNWRVRAALTRADSSAHPGSMTSHGLPSANVFAGHDPALLAAYQHGLSAVYLMGGCLVVVAFLCVCLLPEKPLRGAVSRARQAS